MSDEKRCAAALGEFTDLVLDGRAPSVDGFLLCYSDIEELLRPLLETTLVMFDAFEAGRRRNEVRRRPRLT